MRKLKIARVVALALFVATAVLAAVTTALDMNSAKPIKAAIDEHQSDSDQILSELQATNLKYRGYQESMANIPDSTRMAQSGLLMKQSKEFSKQIRRLEYDHWEATRLLRKYQRSKEAVDARIKRRLLVLGGVGLFFLAGFVVTSLRK